MGFEAAGAGSEHVDGAASHDPANRHSRQAKLAYDLLYRDPSARQLKDRVCRFLTAPKAVPLPSLRFRQNRGIDCSRSQDLPDRPVVLAHDIKECGARILDKMPTISDLDGLWCAFGRRFAVAGTTVARDNLDIGIIAKPSRRRIALAVRKKRYNAAPFKITDNSSVSTASAPRPIVDTHYAQRPGRANGSATNGSQKRVLADGNGKSLGQTVSRAAAERQTKSVNHAFHASRSSRGRYRDTFIEPFGKYRSRTTRS
jgi:hypothetical protein